jgi:4a-hydroxytetrahydrobiopterin dehydratase
MKTLTPEEIATLTETHASWKLAGGKLVRDWTFTDFAEAMGFVNRVAIMAEKADHHPDIDIRYNQVRLGLVSHDAGGITRRDAAMVGKLDEAFPVSA